jgi:hypothetical protein
MTEAEEIALRLLQEKVGKKHKGETADDNIVGLKGGKENSRSVQAFLDAMHKPGEEDALDGPRDIIPGVLAEEQTGLFPGPPGAGKSFVILDWLVRVVLGLEFMGEQCLQGGVIYVTGEGRGGIAKRVAALIKELDLENDHPFIYLNRMPRLLDPQQVADFINAVRIKTARWTAPIRVIAFDTFNRAIVGGSEIDGKDVGRVLDADEQIKRALGCATMFAHHPGKAEGNDTRGHSSLEGDTDVRGVFSRSGDTRTIAIKKSKDGEDGGTFAYSLRKVHLGEHKKTKKPVSTCVVEWVSPEVASKMKSAGKKWTKSMTTFHDALLAAIIDSGFDHRVRGNGPVVRAAEAGCVEAEFSRRYVTKGDSEDPSEARRKAFRRAFKAATGERLIGTEVMGDKELIWMAQNEEKSA